MKISLNRLSATAVLCISAFLTFVAAFPALGANGAVNIIVLPFQASGPDTGKLASELPSLFAAALAKQGVKVVSPSSALALVRKHAITDLNVAQARNLAAQSRATYALYGVITRMGDSFSLDTRMVSAAASVASSARPYFAQKPSMTDLHSAVEEIATSMAADAVSKNTLAGVQVRGLRVLDPEVITMRLATGKGDPVDPAKINDEMKRLWDTGYFSDIVADIEHTGEGMMLVFTVKERPRIDSIDVIGSDAVGTSDILEAIGSKTGSVVSDKILAQDLQKVTDLYKKQGYYLAKVNARIDQKEGAASARLLFEVKEGSKLYIKKIAVTGLQTIDEDVIKEELALKERGLLSWLFKTGVLREEYLDRDSAAIQAWGLNNGYLDIMVSAPQVQYEEDGIVITFAVKEGPRYEIADIGFSGDLIDTPDVLREVVKLDEHKEKDKWMSISVMQDDGKRLADFYSAFGYAFAEVNPSTKVDRERQSISVTYNIDKKKKIYIRRLMTEGNTRTRDNVILREMRMGDGEPFNGEKLRRSNERLYRLRYFTNADTAIIPTGKDDEVDLLVKVAEDRTGALMGGVGYSTYYRFGVSASVSERNLFGKGYTLALSSFLSGRTNSLDLTFTNPHIYDTNLGFTNRSYIVENEWDNFKKKTVGNTLSFHYPIGEYTTVGAGYRLDRYRLTDVPESAPHSYKDYEGYNTSSVLSARVTYDSTDSHERPTRGYIARAFVEYGGGLIGGRDNFIKPEAELQGFHRLFSNNHIFHWRARAGAVYKNSSKPVPVFDRYFIGGIDSIRGYHYEDIVPHDKDYPAEEIGGDRMGYVNLEYIWTVEEKLGIALVPFFDAGFQVDSQQNQKPFDYIKKSVGLELRWRSPMGDLRFAYGYPLDKGRDGKKLSGRFEFSMGQNF